MKFILNKDQLEVQDEKKLNSGSVNYYEVEVEYDESWNEQTIEAVIVSKEGSYIADEGTAIAVINNKAFIDKKISGMYAIAFRGFKVENEVKTYQISSNFVGLYFEKGAGEIEITNEDLPTPTEWENYIAQLQSITSEINGLADSLEEQVQEVEEKLENGDFDGADGITPTIGANGNWYLGDVDTGKPSRGIQGEKRKHR